jgi:hypothetical protein
MLASHDTIKAWKEAGPSHSELSKKLREALLCVQTKLWLPAEPVKLKANWDELEDRGYVESAVLEEEQTKILIGALSEAKPEHYAGVYPPDRSYEQRTHNLEVFCFCWESPFFGNREMYLRFSVVPSGDNVRVWIYSIHPARKPCNKGKV